MRALKSRVAARVHSHAFHLLTHPMASIHSLANETLLHIVATVPQKSTMLSLVSCCRQIRAVGSSEAFAKINICSRQINYYPNLDQFGSALKFLEQSPRLAKHVRILTISGTPKGKFSREQPHVTLQLIIDILSHVKRLRKLVVCGIRCTQTPDSLVTPQTELCAHLQRIVFENTESDLGTGGLFQLISITPTTHIELRRCTWYGSMPHTRSNPDAAVRRSVVIRGDDDSFDSVYRNIPGIITELHLQRIRISPEYNKKLERMLDELKDTLEVFSMAPDTDCESGSIIRHG